MGAGGGLQELFALTPSRVHSWRPRPFPHPNTRTCEQRQVHRQPVAMGDCRRVRRLRFGLKAAQQATAGAGADADEQSVQAGGQEQGYARGFRGCPNDAAHLLRSALYAIQ